MTVTPIWPDATPYEGGWPSIPLISPFSYRDGITFLEKLDKILDWINDELVPEFNDGIQSANTNFNTANASWTAQFNSFMTEVNTALQALNDTAMASLIESPASATSLALQPLYAAKSVVDALNALTTTGYLSQANLNAVYESVANFNTEIATLNSTIATNATTAANAATANQNRVQDNGYMVATFRGDGAGGNGWGGEKLAIFYSPDGRSIMGGAGNPAYIPADGEGVRDPSLIYRNGRFYVAHTSNSGVDKDFAIASSETGVPGTWNLEAMISGATVGSMVHLWAPEWVTDTNGDVYIFFSSVDANSHGSIYWIKALDSTLTNFSAPVLMTWGSGGAPIHYIDACFINVAGTWYMFYSDGTYIGRAKSTTGLTGTWTVDQSGNWAGWGTGLEAPEINWDPQSGVYRFYTDLYQANTGYHYSESTDFVIWTPLQPLDTASGSIRPGELVRHGSFLPLPDKKSQNKLLSAFMKKPLRHFEFANAAGFTVQNGIVTNLRGFTEDTNETTDTSIASWNDATATLTLSKAGLYAISIQLNVLTGTGVTRSFSEISNVCRFPGGAEDTFGGSIGNFKPVGSGETHVLTCLFDCTTSVTVAGRVRVTLIEEL